MSDNNHVKLHNRLFFKMYLSYAFVLTVSAVLIGIIFMKMYKQVTMNNYHEQLLTQAESISKHLQQYIIDEDYTAALSYVDLVEDLDPSNEIWVISNPDADNPMDSQMENIVLDYSNLQKQYNKIINKAFQNQVSKQTFFSQMHGYERNVIGVPVKGLNDEVVGALIYSSPADSQELILDQSIQLILYSIAFAFIVSIVIANIFVRSITRPILQMRNTAMELAAGDYTKKTNIRRLDEIGQLATTVDFLTDKLMENEVERKNLDQMRLDFFANVSHELRTPITVIRAYTETLYDKVVTDEEKIMQYYERMLRECKSMERLVGDLLVLSKMQNPDFEIDKEPVSVLQIFDDIIRSAGAISKEKNITIELKNNSSENDLMFGDYDRLRQMFLVILDNAIKFSKEGSTIHIKIQKSDILTVAIKDEGIGISKEELPYIFDKFYRSKLRQNAKGSGLGLAIAKQIALKHGGTIHVDSEPGQGTEFTFEFRLMTKEELEKLEIG